MQVELEVKDGYPNGYKFGEKPERCLAVSVTLDGVREEALVSLRALKAGLDEVGE